MKNETKQSKKKNSGKYEKILDILSYLEKKKNPDSKRRFFNNVQKTSELRQQLN